MKRALGKRIETLERICAASLPLVPLVVVFVWPDGHVTANAREYQSLAEAEAAFHPKTLFIVGVEEKRMPTAAANHV